MSILTPNNFNSSNIIKFDMNYNSNKNNNSPSSTKNNNNNIKRLNHSQTFDNIFQKETNWPKDINDYDYNKKHLEWGKNPPPNYITKLYISSAERNFNPITQRYSDKKIEEQLKQQEKKDTINSITKGYDSELKNIQVYNIINLEDRLKGLEKNKFYPHIISEKRKKFFQNPPKINYNLLSNLNYKIHHFDKPEKRPNIVLDNKDNIIDFYNNGGKQRQRIIITRSLKDFDIITNEYSKYNNEKNETDLKLQTLKAAKNFYKFRKQNPITLKYYDEEKEKKYQEQNNLNIKKLLNKKKDGLYNPFNGIVYDENGLNLKEKMIENKKLRFKIRRDLENIYQMKDLKEGDKHSNLLNHKLFYDRYKEIEKRRYNIINNKEVLDLNKYDRILKNKKTPWELIKENTNENESISKHQLTISRDKDEIEKQYIQAKIKRIEEIKKLPRIGSDPFFKIKNNISKINISDTNSKILKNENSFSMDKNDWFNKNNNTNLNY